MESENLKILTVTEYNLLANKDPKGSYDRQTRTHLYEIVKKLDVRKSKLSPLEVRLRRKFYKAKFTPMEEKEKKVKREVTRYHLSMAAKRTIQLAGATVMALLVVGFLVYEFALDPSSRKKVDLVYYSGLRKIGIDTNPDIEKIKKDLTITATKLEKVQQVKDQIQQDLTVASSKLEKVQQVKDQIQQDLTVASSKLEKVQQVKDQIQQDLTVASSKLEKVQQDKKKILRDLTVTSSQLEKVQHEKRELTQVVETMILNNKVTENLKYIIRQIYDDPQTQYVLDNDTVTLNFNGKKIASYSTDPDKWYLLGILDSGVTRIFYDDKEILEIETIFGRKGEETPLGEYEIKNRLHNPTWYKKETINGQTIVRPIPFGDPDHEIGHWWLGLKTLDKSVSGSYGIHGVNANKVNDFFKKNFDWRNGSAGCLNIQRWFLEFLANTVPLGAKVNIVPKDKWNRNKIHDPHSAA